jgi:regulatory protein
MKIIKYRKGSQGLYKVELEDGRVLSLYEEVILKFELLLTREILDKDIDFINKFNQECEVYYVALNSIKSRFKSVYDTKEFLLKKEYPVDMIDIAVDKLVKQGYLNDKSFAKSFINNQIVTTNKGPNKIKKELIEHRIDSNIIDEEINVYEDDIQLEKIEKIASRLFKSNRTRGGAVLKRKIINDLIMLGYDNYLVNSVVEKFDFTNDKDLVKKEYDKIYKRLCNKYSGKELEYKIKEKLYQKGLYYED